MTNKIPVAQLFEYIKYETLKYGIDFVIYDKTVGGTETYYIPEDSDGFGFINAIDTELTFTPTISTIKSATPLPRKLTFSIAFHGDTPQEYWEKRQEIAEAFTLDARMTPDGTNQSLQSRLSLTKNGNPAGHRDYLLCIPKSLKFADTQDGLNGEAIITLLAADPHFYNIPGWADTETITSSDYDYTIDLDDYLANQKPLTITIDGRDTTPTGATVVQDPIITVTHRDGSTQKLEFETGLTITDKDQIIFDFYNRTITRVNGFLPGIVTTDITDELTIDSDFETLYFAKGDSINVTSTRTQDYTVTIDMFARRVSL